MLKYEKTVMQKTIAIVECILRKLHKNPICQNHAVEEKRNSKDLCCVFHSVGKLFKYKVGHEDMFKLPPNSSCKPC